MHPRCRRARANRKPLATTLWLERLEDRCVPAIASAPPQILLTAGVLSSMRQAAADNTPQWQAFKARLDDNLSVLIAEDIGSYQGEQLAYIADYALGYQILKNSDPRTAADYADKAIGLLKSGLHDYQKGSWVTRQFLARGDGTTRSFTLPNADFLPSTLTVFLSPVVTDTIVHGAANGQDTANDYQIFLKVSNSPDGPASYSQGTDWAQNPDYGNDQIDWSPAGKEPAKGATYYVTATSGLNANATTAYTVTGNTVRFSQAPAANQAVFVEYIYGTHSDNGSTLAYQQTSAGDGGFNSVFIDDTYSYRYLGRYLSIGLDWLDGYAGMTQSLTQETATMLERWANYIPGNGYYSTSATSNYGAGAYVSEVMTGLALKPRDTTNGPALLDAAVAWRQNNFLPMLAAATTSLAGGYWSEGWNYGNEAVAALLVGSDALESAGLITAAPERQWADQVMDNLLSGQSAPGMAYDGGEDYQFPFQINDRELFYVLSQMCASSAERSYANYVIQNFPDSDFRLATPPDYRDLLFRDPSAPAAFWSALPLQNFASGTGLFTARSDWGDTPTWVSAQIGNWLPMNDHQFDPGHMEINRGGDQLLINAYQAEYVFGDGSLTPDQISQFGNLLVVNDHGDYERTPPNMGVWFGTPGVVDHAEEGTADHAYLYGDYHAAYSPDTDPGSGGPTSELTRQVVFVRPNYVFVFDRVTTLKASYNKILRWHFANAPTVSGNSFVETAGASKLFGSTFSTATIATSLSNFTVGSGSDSFRVQQLDTENASPVTKVRYVTAFQVAPSSTTAMDASQHILSTDSSMEGAQIGNQVVLFGRNGDLTGALNVTYSFDGTTSVQHLLTNLAPGRRYAVTAGGNTTLLNATDQGTLSFDTPAGVTSVNVVGNQLALIGPTSGTLTAGEAFAIKLEAVGSPVPSLTPAGDLPGGVSFTDNQDGTATITGTPDFGISGSYPIQITLHNGVLPDVKVDYTLTVALPHLAIDPLDPVPAGENFSATVHVVDAAGQPDVAFSGSVILTATGPAGGTLNGTTSVPVQNGDAVFGRLYVTTAGDYNLTATTNGADGATTAVGAFATPPVLRFVVETDTASARAGDTVNVTVTALDANGNTIAGYLGTTIFTTTDSQLTPFDYAFTAADAGTHTFPVALKTAGPEWLSVADVSNPAAIGTSPKVRVTAGDIAGLAVSGLPNPAVIGVVHSFRVMAIDIYGNRVRSYRGRVHFDISGGTANLPRDYTFRRGDSGKRKFHATLTALGTGETLSATDTVDATITGKQSNIAVVSTATHLQVRAVPAGTDGNMFTVTVTALDRKNRPDALFADHVQFRSTDPDAALPPDQVFAGTNGSASFTITLNTPGQQIVTVADNDRPAISGTSGWLAVSAGTARAQAVRHRVERRLAGSRSEADVATMRAADGGRGGC
jgi:hypothetical protein